MSSNWNPGVELPSWASPGRGRGAETPSAVPGQDERLMEPTLSVRKSEKFFEVRTDFHEPGVIYSTYQAVLSKAARDELLSCQGQKLYGTQIENIWYKKGYKGYTMLKKDGKGMTVKYEQVGALCKKIHDMLLPLMAGPFGGAGQPERQAISTINMEIRNGPLEIESFTSIDAFVAAVDALPNPAANDVSTPMGEDTPVVKELKEWITKLVTSHAEMKRQIASLQEQVTDLARDAGDISRRKLPRMEQPFP